jgi:hypothetical protein
LERNGSPQVVVGDVIPPHVGALNEDPAGKQLDIHNIKIRATSSWSMGAC